MNEKNFDKLLKSIRQAGAIKRGERKASRVFELSLLDVKKVREKIGLSQTQLSVLIHVSVRTLQNWEQGRRTPRGPALALLTALKKQAKAYYCSATTIKFCHTESDAGSIIGSVAGILSICGLFRKTPYWRHTMLLAITQ